MISGVLTLYPKFGKETYIETKTKQNYRHLPAVTEDGINVCITITEDMYNQYCDQIMVNDWENTNKFVVWGELRSTNDTTTNTGLTNLYMRVDFMIPDYKNTNFNLFSLNSHGTKTKDESDELHNYFYVAANKNILNPMEKRNKPSYSFLRTPKRVQYQDKDIIQGTVKLIENNGHLSLEAIHTVGFSSCRKLVNAFLIKEAV